MTLNEYLGQATIVTQDNINNGEIDFKGKDKRMDVITVVLNSDVEISADQFCELFGTPEYAYWLEKDTDDKAEVGGSKEMAIGYCYDNGIYGLDLILNGYQLKINGNSTEVGIGIYGNLRIWGRANDNSNSKNPNGLVLHGRSTVFGSMLYAAVRGTSVTFDSINITSTKNPVYMSYLGYEVDKDGVKLTSQTLTIKSSTLKFENIIAASTQGQMIRICFTALNESGFQYDKVDWRNYYCATGYTDNGKMMAYCTDGSEVEFIVSYYMYDADGNKVVLPLAEYFGGPSETYGYSYKCVDGDEMYGAYLSGCTIDIKDSDGNDITVRISGSGDWYTYEGKDNAFKSDNVSIDSNSKIMSSDN